MKDKYLHETLSKSKRDQVKHCIQLCRELLAKKNSIALLFQNKNCSFLVEFLVILGKIKFCLGIYNKIYKVINLNEFFIFFFWKFYLEIFSEYCNSQESISNLHDRKIFDEFNMVLKELLDSVQSTDTL